MYMELDWRPVDRGSEILITGFATSWLDPMVTDGPRAYWAITVVNGYKEVRDERDTLGEAKARAEEIIREEFGCA